MFKNILLSFLLIVLCACTINENNEKLSISGHIVLIDDNGNADIDISNTDLLAKGFNYGDSVNIELENGYKLQDITFLSGMYVEYAKLWFMAKLVKIKFLLFKNIKVLLKIVKHKNKCLILSL